MDLAKVGFAVFVPIVLAGCVQKRVLTQSQAYNPQETAWFYDTKGSGEVKGSALIRQAGGGVVTCAGSTVRLAPKSLYADERMSFLYSSLDRGYLPMDASSNMVIPSTDSRYADTAKTAICDAQGFFTFKDLPKGNYYVTTTITWQVRDYRREGGYLMASVNLGQDESKEIVLTPIVY